MNKMKFTKEKKTEMMAIGSHCKGLKTSHNRRKDVKAEEINRMSKEDYERELVYIGLKLIHLEMILQKENQMYGWIMKKNKVRWISLQVE